MNKEDIKNLPIFPEVVEEWEDTLMTLSSAVYVHFESDDMVEVYKFPVVEAYTKNPKETKQMAINRFLISCLRISKYAIITEEMTKGLPLIEVLYKSDNHFLDKIHYKYP